MKKFAALLFVSLLFLAPTVHASEIAELKQKMIDARKALYILLTEMHRRGPDQQKLVKDTADAVSAKIAVMKAPAGKEVKFKELTDTWKAFKKTREEELVPRIMSGRQDEAEKIATGIQNERFTKMMILCEELNK